MSLIYFIQGAVAVFLNNVAYHYSFILDWCYFWTNACVEQKGRSDFKPDTIHQSNWLEYYKYVYINIFAYEVWDRTFSRFWMFLVGLSFLIKVTHVISSSLSNVFKNCFYQN